MYKNELKELSVVRKNRTAASDDLDVSSCSFLEQVQLSHFLRQFKKKEIELVQKNARALQDGRIYQVDIHNLDIILSVGYRVNSKRRTHFREWINKVLKGH